MSKPVDFLKKHFAHAVVSGAGTALGAYAFTGSVAKTVMIGIGGAVVAYAVKAMGPK